MQIEARNPKDKILTGETMIGILTNGTIMGFMAYGVFLAEYFHNPHLSNHYEKAMTVTFISIIFGQYANLLSRRTYGPALDKYSFSNGKLLEAFAFSISGILLIVYVPILDLYFHTSPLLAIDWLFPIMAGVICLSIFEFRKKDTINNVTPKIKPRKQIYIINGLTPIGHPFKAEIAISKTVN